MWIKVVISEKQKKNIKSHNKEEQVLENKSLLQASDIPTWTESKKGNNSSRL